MKLLFLVVIPWNVWSSAFTVVDVPTARQIASQLLSSNIDISSNDITNIITRKDGRDDTAKAGTMKYNHRRQHSYVRNIRSHNLAGFVSLPDGNDGNGNDNRDIVITLFDASNEDDEEYLQQSNNLIVITGETASGKSLFTVRALEIITGKITSTQKLASYVHQSSNAQPLTTSSAFVEVEVFLVDPHLSAIETLLHHRYNVDSGIATTTGKTPLQDNRSRLKRFLFRRTIQLIPANANDTQNEHLIATQKYRMKSTCTINGDVIPLKDFVALTTPLFAIVDATTAVNAIMSNAITYGSSSSMRRTAILDTAICKRMLWKHTQARQWFVLCRQQRVQYEKEIVHQQSLFRSPGRTEDSDDADQQHMKLISHYIDEFDSFETRMTRFCQSLVLVAEEDDDLASSFPIINISKKLSRTTWNENSDEGAPSSSMKKTISLSTSASANYVSKMYILLLEFRNEFKLFDDQCNTVNEIVQTLGSLAMSNSALSAVHRTRKLVTKLVDDAMSNDHAISPLQKSTELLHGLLDQADSSLRECVQFIERDTEYGILTILDRVRGRYPQISLEYIDEMINEWKFLSRKHNLSPYLLPKCHENYKDERDGTNHLRHSLLPQAYSLEEKAYEKYWNAYQVVTKEREDVAHNISQTITERYLPLLGFAIDTFFSIEIHRSNETTSSPTLLSSPLLVDTTDFLLSRPTSSDTSTISTNAIHDIASSGERARILFAMECALPGSIGAACRSLSSSYNAYENPVRRIDGTIDVNSSSTNEYENKSIPDIEVERWYNYTSLLPIAIIYDEIDAHIGGRAVKAMAKLLVQQSSMFQQVVAITHNPTIAAAAQTHIIIQKNDSFRLSSSANDTAISWDGDSIMNNNDTSSLQLSNASCSDVVLITNSEPHTQEQQQQSVSVCVVQNDPYNTRRIQELVRMVCGSNEDENTKLTIHDSATTSGTNIEAKAFVKSLICDINASMNFVKYITE
jgi:DNA repair ATPase RecN